MASILLITLKCWEHEIFDSRLCPVPRLFKIIEPSQETLWLEGGDRYMEVGMPPGLPLEWGARNANGVREVVDESPIIGHLSLIAKLISKVNLTNAGKGLEKNLGKSIRLWIVHSDSTPRNSIIKYRNGTEGDQYSGA